MKPLSNSKEKLYSAELGLGHVGVRVVCACVCVSVGFHVREKQNTKNEKGLHNDRSYCSKFDFKSLFIYSKYKENLMTAAVCKLYKDEYVREETSLLLFQPKSNILELTSSHCSY